MRGIDCTCGHHLTAEDDEALFPKAKDHMTSVHPDMAMTDDQIRQFITAKASDE